MRCLVVVVVLQYQRLLSVRGPLLGSVFGNPAAGRFGAAVGAVSTLTPHVETFLRVWGYVLGLL